MADTGTEDRDLSVDTGIRSHIEAAMAAHRPAGPDVDLNARSIQELDQATRRAREDGKDVQKFSDLRPEDRKRLQIRAAVMEVRDRAANAPAKEAFAKGGVEGAIHNQPPGTWSAEAKAEFNRLPHSVRDSVLRDQNYSLNTFGRMAQEYGAIRKTIDEHRDIIPPGVKDGELVGNMFRWARELRGPNSGRAFLDLMGQTGTSIEDVIKAASNGPPPYNQQPQYPPSTPETEAATAETLTRFAQTHPDFEQLRGLMGQILQSDARPFTSSDGTVNLDLLHAAAQQYATGGEQRAAEIGQQLTSFAETHPRFQEVRATMGQMLAAAPTRYGPTGFENIEQLYREACRRHDGKAKAAVSPSGRSPSASQTKNEKAVGIRAAIRNAISEHKEGRI